MSERIIVTTEQRIAVVQIDNPPVNALSVGVPEELAAAIDRLERDPGVDAIVIMGAGKTFVAGADINDLEQAAWNPNAAPPDFHPLFERIENSSKPVVMAVAGAALGGGLELAMAGHYRVATPDARVGQPEVNLGIIPGAEGTQRLTRLVGVEKAIELCVSGKPISASDAKLAGLIDHVLVDPPRPSPESPPLDPRLVRRSFSEGGSPILALMTGAVAFARAAVSRGRPHQKTRDRVDKLGTRESNAPLFAAGRALANKTRRNQKAPLAAIEAIEAAATLPFEEGCRREREIALACLRSDQCRALVHAFFAERHASKVPDVPKDAAIAHIDRVAIIGAGTMGGGIAMACANAGFQVLLADVGAEALDRGMATVRRNYESSVKRGRLSPGAMQQRLGLIEPGTGYERLRTADLIIEAVFESMAVKKQVFAELDRVAKPGCILATNTSTLDIDEIASVTARPESVVGTHFFSPANVMRLLEIVRGRATDPSMIASALALAKRLGKVGVVVRNAPGFVGNRIMFPYMYEAQFLVEEGASPEQVDRVLTDWGMAMGIFAVDDMAGIDVAWRVRQELHQFEEPGARKPLVADKLVEMGRFGQKTGKGWYRYGEDRKPAPDPDVLALIEQATTSAGIRRRAIDDEEILERTIYALVNEGARVLEEGIALRAGDIDVIYLTGYGFPSYRGGPMFYADQVGLPRILERVEAFSRELGERWKPAPLLAKLAREGSTFREFDRRSGRPPRAR